MSKLLFTYNNYHCPGELCLTYGVGDVQGVVATALELVLELGELIKHLQDEIRECPPLHSSKLHLLQPDELQHSVEVLLRGGEQDTVRYRNLYIFS